MKLTWLTQNYIKYGIVLVFAVFQMSVFMTPSHGPERIPANTELGDDTGGDFNDPAMQAAILGEVVSGDERAIDDGIDDTSASSDILPDDFPKASSIRTALSNYNSNKERCLVRHADYEDMEELIEEHD